MQTEINDLVGWSWNCWKATYGHGSNPDSLTFTSKSGSCESSSTQMMYNIHILYHTITYVYLNPYNMKIHENHIHFPESWTQQHDSSWATTTTASLFLDGLDGLAAATCRRQDLQSKSLLGLLGGFTLLQMFWHCCRGSWNEQSTS